MPHIAPSSAIPYKGWTWRGARLEAAELAAYTTGAQTRHLGVADTRTGGEREFPVLFRVYARQAWATPGDLEEIRFPPDAEFLVREVQSLAGDRICIHLEQATEDAGTDPGLAREFRAWLPTVIGRLPRPDADLEVRWAAPFACWYRGAQSGDAPRTGIVYDAEDACRFVVEGTGQDEATVRKVLGAMQRYLELAHLSEDSQDGDLEREREAMRHLLPGEPGVIENEPRLAYLGLVTGLGEDVLEDILDMEFQYCDSIGLLEPEEEEEEGIHRILDDHLEHWEAVAYDLDAVLDGLREDPRIEGLRASVPSPSPRWWTVTSSAVPQSGALETVRIDGRTGDAPELITAFPAARDGAGHLLRIRGVRERSLGCEALVEAVTASGLALCYFDIDHLHPWNEREEAEEVTVALAAFALSLGPAPDRELYLDPVGDGEARFQGRVETLDVAGAWDQILYRMDIALCAAEDPFILPIYATAGFRPRLGEVVQGRLWLQGGLPRGRGVHAIFSC